MTVVNPKSISGINSITTGSGSDNLLTNHTNDGTERVRVDSTGATKVGSGVTLSPDGDIFATGVTTSTTVQVGSATTIHTTGIDLGNGNLTGHNLHSTGITTSSSVVVGGGVTISESGIEASGIGITCANINGTQIGGRRNLVINGSMQVAQRGTSSTSNGFQTVDRYNMNVSGTDEAPTIAQVDVSSSDSGDNPFTKGLTKAIRLTNGNQTSGAGAADRIRYWTIIEAQTMRNSGWNYTSTSSFVTLSFYVKSSVSQNFFVRLTTGDGTSQSYIVETGTLTANTWTRVVKTIPGNSNIQFDDDVNQGLYIVFVPFRGTDNTGTRPLNAWAAFDSSTMYPDMTSTWYTTNDATFEVTGLQLEVGSQATPFEHLSFGEELKLCQRYYQSHKYGTYIGFNFIGRKSGSNTCIGVMHGIPPMRAAATGTFTGAFKLYRITDGSTHASTSVSVSVIDDTFFNAVKFSAECTGSFSTGNMATVFTSGSGGQYDLDAEVG